MGSQYADLVAQWKAAASATRKAQLAIKEQFEAHATGGRPPSDAALERLKVLRDTESQKLQAITDHLAAQARGGSAGFGEL